MSYALKNSGDSVMSKYDQQIKLMMRKPHLMLDFQMTGRLPEMIKLDSPLIRYLESLERSERDKLRHIRLHPKLGYNTSFVFNNYYQLMNWLKPSEYIHVSCPSESYRIKNFNTVITTEIFESVQSK